VEIVEIVLEGCRLRDWRRSDATSLALHANNRKVWRNLRDLFPHPYSRSDARTWIRKQGAEERQTTFAIDFDGEAVGAIGLMVGRDVQRLTAEIGFWIGEPFWGRGIMTRAVSAVTEFGFDSLDLRRIQAEVFAWNPASARVLEKAGYRLEGRMANAVFKDGQVIDALMYATVR
jgi:ribosomal-protein-alanine N-acetyltransferase